MATKGHSKRRHSTTTGKRRNASPKKKGGTVYSSAEYKPSGGFLARRRNAHTGGAHHHKRPRRNPLNTGMVTEGFKLAGGGVLIGFFQPWVRGLVGKFLPTGPIASAAVTLGTGYGLGAVAGMFGPTRRLKQPIELAAWTIVGAQVISSYVLPWVNSIFSGLNLNLSAGAPTSTGASGLGRARVAGRRTMRDLVTLPQGDYDPYWGSTPAFNSSPALLPAASAAAAEPPRSQQQLLSDLLTLPAGSWNGMMG